MKTKVNNFYRALCVMLSVLLVVCSFPAWDGVDKAYASEAGAGKSGILLKNTLRIDFEKFLDAVHEAGEIPEAVGFSFYVVPNDSEEWSAMLACGYSTVDDNWEFHSMTTTLNCNYSGVGESCSRSVTSCLTIEDKI